MIELAAFAKKFWPIFVIVPLVFVVLFMRNTISKQEGELNVAALEISSLTATNEANKKAMEILQQRQFDNDAIAEAVAEKLAVNETREVHTREVIERLKNDPVVRDWASVPVPDGVREALRRR